MVQENLALTIWGNFSDNKTEKTYQQAISKDINVHNRVSVLAAGIGYWFVTLADYAKLGLEQGFYISALLRLIYLVLCISIYLTLRRKNTIVLTRNLSFVATLGNSFLIISVIYFLNPDGQIDIIDQLTVPIVTLLFYIFMYIPLPLLLFNGILVTVMYSVLLMIMKSSVDTIINIVAILGCINFMGFFFNRFLNASKRKEYVHNLTIESLNNNLMQEVEERKQTQNNLEHALEQITDSIKYAQKIQFALLPNKSLLENNFKESALFFRPKNIVSGDFYWVNKIENKTIIAVADCTGHGIPGAFMSVLGISLLNDIVKNSLKHNEEINASDILNRLRTAVIASLKQSGDNSDRRDGMDIALLVVDSDKKELQFAGAYNGIWLIRNTNGLPELTEFKGDKMPIGIHTKFNDSYFSQKHIPYHDDDIVYLFTDGYKDQFGGVDGKKFLAKQMKELVLSNYGIPLRNQQCVLEQQFETWKGDFQQVDDILVMALKL